MNPAKLAQPFLLSVLAVLALWIVLTLFYRSLSQSSVAVTLMSFVFFSYGHFFNLVYPGNFPIQIFSGFFVLIFAAAPIFFFLVSARAIPHKRLTPYLNVMSGILFAIPLITIASYQIYPAHKAQINIPDTLPLSKGSIPPPDIYYIILDEYARADVLKNRFAYDNKPFLDFLRRKGFYVADQSTSNYFSTVYSLASSLNFRYVDENENFIGMIKNNAAAQSLKAIGYQYIFLNSGATMTEYSPQADKMIGYFGENDVHLLFINSTLLASYASPLFSGSWRGRHFYSFAKLGSLPKHNDSKFVFAHILLPHPPFVFRKDGRPYTGASLRFTPNYKTTHYLDAYPEQTAFTNALTKRLVDQILLLSKRPPIIILQSDHGADPLDPFYEKPESFHIRFANFTAIFAPGKENIFYPSISPVNIFRVIFNEYFGTKLPLLPDKMYFDQSFNEDIPYRVWRDVTQIALLESKRSSKISVL